LHPARAGVQLAQALLRLPRIQSHITRRRSGRGVASRFRAPTAWPAGVGIKYSGNEPALRLADAGEMILKAAHHR